MNCRNLQLNDRLVAERNRLGLTQDDMATACKTAKRTYCDYESGKSEPRGSFFEALALAGGDVNFVITGQRAVETLKPEEAALLDSFRAMCPEQQATFKTVGTALAQPSGKKPNAA